MTNLIPTTVGKLNRKSTYVCTYLYILCIYVYISSNNESAFRWEGPLQTAFISKHKSGRWFNVISEPRKQSEFSSTLVYRVVNACRNPNPKPHFLEAKAEIRKVVNISKEVLSKNRDTADERILRHCGELWQPCVRTLQHENIVIVV